MHQYIINSHELYIAINEIVDITDLHSELSINFDYIVEPMKSVLNLYTILIFFLKYSIRNTYLIEQVSRRHNEARYTDTKDPPV